MAAANAAEKAKTSRFTSRDRSPADVVSVGRAGNVARLVDVPGDAVGDWLGVLNVAVVSVAVAVIEETTPDHKELSSRNRSYRNI